MKPVIHTVFVSPPIPNCDHWCAWDDNQGADCSPYGRGLTEAEAVEDLKRQLEEMDT